MREHQLVFGRIQETALLTAARATPGQLVTSEKIDAVEQSSNPAMQEASES